MRQYNECRARDMQVVIKIRSSAIAEDRATRYVSKFVLNMFHEL